MPVPTPARSALGIAGHGCGLFLLPFAVGWAAGLVFEVSEVADTASALTVLSAVFIVPPLVLQVAGVAIKVARERAMLRAAGRDGRGELLASVHRHLRILTPRGWGALATGLAFVVLALSVKWASLGVLAVLSLLLLYAVVGGSSLLSAFGVRTFERGLARRGSGISREMSPAVVLAGEPAEERFHLERVPVPAGFVLVVEDPNPPVLATESRYVVGPGARRSRVTVSGRFRRTPRGLHRLGPARVFFQDAFGLTRVSVAALATAELKVLPRFRPLEIVAPPRAALDAPDLLTRPHRFATEEWFRFKEYAPGDDTRRIHWRLSVRRGALMVRAPEARETTTRQVLLVLDDYLPPGRMLRDAVGMGRILDALVEVWISLAGELVERGDRVVLVAPVQDARGEVRVERLTCDPTEARRWQDMGARAAWQGRFDLPEVLGTLGPDLHGVAVSARFFEPPPREGGASFTWVVLPPERALGARQPPFWEELVGAGPGAGWRLLRHLVQLPGPAGSDDNALVRQATRLWRQRRAWEARRRLRLVARAEGRRTLAALQARGESVYLVEPGPVGHRLVGVVAGRPA